LLGSLLSGGLLDALSFRFGLLLSFGLCLLVGLGLYLLVGLGLYLLVGLGLCLLVGLGLRRRLFLLLGLSPGADAGDRRSDLGRDAFLDQDLQLAVVLSLEVECGLVRLDLGKHLALLDLVAGRLLPLHDRALLHRVGELGHVYVRHLTHALSYFLYKKYRPQVGIRPVLRQRDGIRHRLALFCPRRAGPGA